MLERAPYEYVIIRVVPRVERGEFINAGVVLICRPMRFLKSRVHLDASRLMAIDPTMTESLFRSIETQLETLALIAQGDRAGGPLAELSMAERWHLLSAPSSTMLQPSPVHTGLSLDPEGDLDDLFREFVEIARPVGF